MPTYKFTSPDNKAVAKIDEDGLSRMSCSIEHPEFVQWLSEGNVPEPADPLPNPRIAEIQSLLAAIDMKSIRALRANETARLAELELQASLLRTELGEL